MQAINNTSGEPKQAVVLGLGCGGGRIVASLGRSRSADNFMAVAADTDHHDLARLDGVLAMRLGTEWNCVDGCGDDPELGERIVAGCEQELLQAILPTRLLIVVAGLGSGTGTGGARVLARIVRDHSIPALFVLTFPFSFEGNWPRQQAEAALAGIREITDTVMVVHNDLLLTAVGADIPARQAFQQIDNMLGKTIAGLLGIAWADWLLKADFATIRNLLSKHPARCDLGFGLGHGDRRWHDAVESFVECPLLGGHEHLQQVDTAIITVGSDNDISVAELRQCMAAVQQHFPENTRLLVGAYASTMHSGEVQITGICCRFKSPGDDQYENRLAAGSGQVEKLPQAGQPGGHLRMKAPGGAAAVQEELPFQEETLGIFSAATPTIFNGENLDAPTFQRRGIQLDLGQYQED